MGKRIEIKSDGNHVRMWVDGEEVEGMVHLKFEAGMTDKGECDIQCSYWKYKKNRNGRYLVLNNEIITEQVVVSD